MTSEREPRPALAGIVEDNADIAEMYVLLLQARNIRVSFVARDGAEAVDRYRDAEPKPDVLLIDHRMPIKSGLYAMREIMATNPGACFIFISADEGIREDVLAAGARAFLRKPATVREIYDAVDQVRRLVVRGRSTGGDASALIDGDVDHDGTVLDVAQQRLVHERRRPRSRH